MTREEAIERIKMILEEATANEDAVSYVTSYDAEALDMAIKTLEQEPKTGHWKRISIDKYSEHAKYWYRCDKCGKDNLGNTDWCPNCGCRMVEPQESEDTE